MPRDTFLSCDWGTSHFRLRLVDRGTLCVLDEVKTDEGVGSIAREGAPELRRSHFENILAGRAQEIINRSGANPATCIISGMASSNIGWHQLPYAKAPITLDPANLGTYTFTVPMPESQDLKIVLISGVRTENDIMRGEETELLGLLGIIPDLKTASALIILPGTHSKHVRLKSSVLTGFTTYMTGELYAHLQNMPTLKALLAGSGALDKSEFLAGVDCVSKEGLMGALFKTRTRLVLSSERELSGQSFLSGLLIGAELTDIKLEEGRCIYACCSISLIIQYSLAANHLGLSLRFVSADTICEAIIRSHSLFLKQSKHP